MAFRRSTNLLATLLLAGCAVGPNFKQPSAPSGAGYTPEPLARTTTSTPAQFGGAQSFIEDKDISGRWWELFQSQALNELVDRSFRANPTIAAAQAALGVARENMLAQGGTLLPSVGLDVSGSKNQTSIASLAPVAANNKSIYSLYSAGLTVSYSLDAFGLGRRTVESFAAQADNQRFELEAAYLTLSTNVVLAAIQEAGLRGQIAAQQETIKADTQLRDILQREYALGEIAQSDVLQQEAVLAQAEERLPSMQKELALQRNALIALVGGLPNEDLAANFELSSLHLPQELPVSIASKLVEQRPDILAAAATLHAASAQVGVAIANRLPQLSLTASFGTSPGAIANAFSPYNQFFTVIGKLSQPIFDGGTLMHRQRAAQAAFDQAAAQYRVTVIGAYQNVADVLRALQYDANTLQAAVTAEQAASRSLDLTQKQQQFGAMSNLDVLNAEQIEEAARLAVVQAQSARLADTAALFQALGGGWWNRSDPLPSPGKQIAGN
ncbi:efflux transporter outer membrane subunit [Trinickia mobilis]|uniref:efflux transporter outer membrane subunit n=1 Tax=Trinickia mobilis TaxID=2816356 RepID=UPI001A8F184B|nr:efflux transporter outer membrane subunit [Trinickia mobilis]